jgi:hypothetical protein
VSSANSLAEDSTVLTVTLCSRVSYQQALQMLWRGALVAPGRCATAAALLRHRILRECGMIDNQEQVERLIAKMQAAMPVPPA